MDQAIGMKCMALRFLANHLYEYRKGVRRLFMMTLTQAEASRVCERLERETIPYLVHDVSADKVNVLFGRAAWVDTARSILGKPLSKLSPEEDFILGTLLGYETEQQCERFLAFSRIARAVA